MSVPSTDIRRTRSSAKGNITKLSKETHMLESSDVQLVDIRAVDKCLDQLAKFNDIFLTSHEQLMESQDETAKEQLMEEYTEQGDIVSRVGATLRGVRSRFDAFEVVSELTMALSALELKAKTGYSAELDDDVADARLICQRLHKARAKPVASTCPKLKEASEAVILRLQALQKAKHSLSVPVAEPAKEEASASEELEKLKIECPRFDGTMTGWRDFYDFFSTLLTKRKKLDDTEKKCLFLTAMDTPECRARAKKASMQNATYEGVIETFRNIYEKNRVVHMHHYMEMNKPSSFDDTFEDIGRFTDVVKDKKRGIKMAQAYTAGQMFTAHYESRMTERLHWRWMDYTKHSNSTPDVEKLIEFLDDEMMSLTSSRSIPEESIEMDDSPPVAPPTSNPQRFQPSTSRQNSQPSKRQQGKTVHLTQASSQSDKCHYCKGDHGIFRCTLFSQMSVRQRRDWARPGNCNNCLSPKHKVQTCNSSRRCRECRGKHHSLLHENPTTYSQGYDKGEATPRQSEPGVSLATGKSMAL